MTTVEGLISTVSETASAAASSAAEALTAANTAQAMAQYHGTCSTSAATTAKVVTCSGFTLATGAKIAVKFTYANTASSPTLNVNSTGAISIRQIGAAAASGAWAASEVCLFEYDGTYWNLIKASVTLSNITGTLAISKGGTGSTTASAALSALGGATMSLYTCTCNTSWTTNSSGGYYKTITVSGILSTDVPVVGVQMSTDVTAATNQGKAFACINRITTASNSITCYAFSSAPTTSITLQLLVVRSA